MEACKAKDMEEMGILQFTDFMLSFSIFLYHVKHSDVLSTSVWIFVCVMGRPRPKPTTKATSMLASLKPWRRRETVRGTDPLAQEKTEIERRG